MFILWFKLSNGPHFMRWEVKVFSLSALSEVPPYLSALFIHYSTSLTPIYLHRPLLFLELTWKVPALRPLNLPLSIFCLEFSSLWFLFSSILPIHIPFKPLLKSYLFNEAYIHQLNSKLQLLMNFGIPFISFLAPCFPTSPSGMLY